MRAWSDCLSSTAWRWGRSGGRAPHSLLTEAPRPDTKPALLTRHIVRPGGMRRGTAWRRNKGMVPWGRNEGRCWLQPGSFHLYKLVVNVPDGLFYVISDLWRRKSLLWSLPQHQNWCYSDLWRSWRETEFKELHIFTWENNIQIYSWSSSKTWAVKLVSSKVRLCSTKQFSP